MAPLILDLGTGWSAEVHSMVFYHREKALLHIQNYTE